MRHRANGGGEGIGPRTRSALSWVSSLAMVVGGLILIAPFFLDFLGHAPDGDATDGDPRAPRAGAQEEHLDVRARTADGGPRTRP